MTISIKHKFVNPKSDTADATVTRASNWNDEHELTLAQNRVLGRISAANGPVEELTGEQVRTISDTLQAGVLSGVNTRTASYTLVASDRGKVIEMNVAGANTVTIPNEVGIGGVNFPVGTLISVVQFGTGQTTLLPAAGVTVRSVSGGLSTSTRYGSLVLYKRAANDWFVIDQTSAYLDGRVDNLEFVAGGLASISTVASNITDVNTVAADLNEPVSEIETVAGSINNVNTVGTNIANVNTVATNIGNVNNVGSNIASVNLNASNMAVIQSASANAAAALSSANAAASSATAAAGSATNAASSATTAVAAAQSSGNIVFYDTKALADAGLAGLPANQVIEIFADESRSGQRTRYRKEGAVYVFKMVLPKGIDVYVDSISGSDSNDGLTPNTPKKTLEAANTLAQIGSTIYLARGSQWFGGSFSFTKTFSTIRPYGQGNKPIMDGAIAVTGSWTQDATYTNLWYIDVTYPVPITGDWNSNRSNSWHPNLWDEASSSRTVESSLTRVLNADVVNGTTVSQTTIAGLLNIANTTPGSFTVHRTGSTSYEPRADNGSTYRFYVNLADGSNPNTNGRTIYTVPFNNVVNFGAGITVQEIVMQRNGAKDMVGVWGGVMKAQVFVDCEFLEAACHATVAGGVEFRRCIAKAAKHGDSVTTGGGGYHNYRGPSTDGTSRGFKIYDCEAWGFAHAVYSHGDASTAPEHVTFDVDGLLAVGCTSVISMGKVQKSGRFRRIVAINCYAAASMSGSVYEDCAFINLGGSITSAWAIKDTVTFKNCFFYKPSGKLEIIDAYPLGSQPAANYPTAIFENSTVYAEVLDPGNTFRAQQNWVLKNSIFHKYIGGWLSGSITATNSYIGLEGSDLTALRVTHPNIAADCISNRQRNKFQKTVVLSDLGFAGSTRLASYSGTPNADGTATLTMNFNDRAYNRYIRIVDAYGAGQHYHGRVVTPGTLGSDPIVVTPAPTSAFSNKELAASVWSRKIWDPAFSETVSISTSGLQIRVADPTLYTVGTLIWVGKIGNRGEDHGPRLVTAITGNVLTLNAACPWFTSGDSSGVFNNIENTVSNRQPLPTVAIGYGFPIVVNNGSYPQMSMTAVEGGSATVTVNASVNLFNTPTGISSVSYTFSTKRTSGAPITYGTVFGREGYIDSGWGFAVGDTVTVEAAAYVDYWEPKFASNPLLSLDGSLLANSHLSKLGIGYAKRTLRGV